MTICCLNPNCHNPSHAEETQSYCSNCGMPLVRLKDRYRPVKSLGGGGASKTYLAYLAEGASPEIDIEAGAEANKEANNPGDRYLILQFVPPASSAYALETAKERFFQEARQLEKLGDIPQIPKVLECFEEDGYFYLVQEYIEGHSLRQELEAGGTFQEERIRELLLEMLPVLNLLHQHDIIHGNIKPENIIYLQTSPGKDGGEQVAGEQGTLRQAQEGAGENAEEDPWKDAPSNLASNLPSELSSKLAIANFGIAQQLIAQELKTNPGSGLTTFKDSIGYVPLEQLENGTAYPASDLYSLATTCFHLLAGIHPGELWKKYGYSWVGGWRECLKAPLSDGLARIFDRLLQPDYRQRYQSAAEVESELHRLPPIPEPIPEPELISALPEPAIAPTSAPQPTPQTTPETATLSGDRRKLLKRRRFLKRAGLIGVGFVIAGAVGLRSGLLRDPNKIVVAKTGKADYRKISDAIKNAAPGARIKVRSGIYNESIIIDKPLEIVGDGEVEEIVIESISSDCIRMETDSAVVQGITLIGRSIKHNAVYISQGELLLENCTITSKGLAGVAIQGDRANPTLRNCQIRDGSASGVFAYEKARGTIEDCEIIGNGHAGVEIKEGANPTVRNCQIRDGKESGVFVYDKGLGTIEDCQIVGNSYAGVEIKSGGNPVIRRCQINKNRYYAVFVHPGGSGTVESNDLTGNGRGSWRLDGKAEVKKSSNKQ
ncbi:MAG: protein kinase [Oscillatoria sp. SIO1A7]|nr:protein kinase [Oscillatoria sp. SIO1A7]